MEDIGGRIEREVGSWDGVTTHAHRFGGTEFRLGRRELGHLHGDAVADVPLSPKLQDRLLRDGMALEPGGWVKVPLDTAEGALRALALLRGNYEREEPSGPSGA